MNAPQAPSAPVKVTVRPFGPGQDVADRLAKRVMRHPVVRKMVGRHRHRLLRFQFVGSRRKTRRPKPPHRYRATIFDYEANQAYTVEGPITGDDAPKVRKLAGQPLPTAEEWEAAVEVIRAHPRLGPKIRRLKLTPYQPMPVLISEPRRPDGRPPRILIVGWLPPEGEPGHMIIGVDLWDDSVIEFPGGSPEASCADNILCGVPHSEQRASSGGVGQREIWVEADDGGELWKMMAVRPSAVEGQFGAGIEIKNVYYRGKLVLGSAGARIQNVNYEASAPCGHVDESDPQYHAYLDWTNEESLFQASQGPESDGFRECDERPLTVLDTGQDGGNFQGVVIYRDGSELVLVTQLKAGFYRYVNEWRFDDDGTIRPRFGWTAISNCCVCYTHHHHVYWRLDFDIGEASPNRFREYFHPYPGAEPFYRTLTRETKDTRGPKKLWWIVENVDTGDCYQITPGEHDGSWMTAGHPFGDGDVWFLRQDPGEIEQTVAEGEPQYHANIDKWISRQNIDGWDVVMWYGVHSTHDQDPDATHVHELVGPDLQPQHGW